MRINGTFYLIRPVTISSEIRSDRPLQELLVAMHFVRLDSGRCVHVWSLFRFDDVLFKAFVELAPQGTRYQIDVFCFHPSPQPLK